MKYLSFLLLFFPISTYSQLNEKGNLEQQLEKLNTNTALIIKSQAIDEYPLWSENSDYVACNIMGKWHKIRLIEIELEEFQWNDKQIGVLITQNAISILDENELNDYKKSTKYDSRKITTKTGIEIELKMEKMNTLLTVSKKGAIPSVIYSFNEENCHSISLSPNQKYIAYLCELTGLIVLKIDDSY